MEQRNLFKSQEFAATAIWSAGQILVLVAGWYDFPLAAKLAVPASGIAVQIMLVVQVLLVIPLSGLLLKKPENLAISIMIATVMILLAGQMASLPLATTGITALYISLWLTALHALLQTNRLTILSLIQAVLLVLAFAGPIIWYLEMEFGGHYRPIQWFLTLVSPTVGSVIVCRDPPQILKVGFLPTSILIAYAVLRLTKPHKKQLQSITSFI